MTQPTDIAYVAGLFDGEGSVSILEVKSSHKSGKRYHRLDVSITMTDPRALIRVNEMFGGHIGTKKATNARARTAFRWKVSGSIAETFIRAIRPFLVIKSEQADIALAFRQTLRSRSGMANGRHGQAKDPVSAVEAERGVLRGRMLQLNRRGA